MRILLVHQYFKTPEEGGGIRSWHIVKAIKDAGHEVTVLTTNNSIRGTKIIDGVTVNYFQIFYDNRLGFIQRIVAFLRFVWHARAYIRKDHNYDLLYVISTPLTTGLIGLFGKGKYGIPYVFEVGDLWPEVPVKLGFIKPKWLQNQLYRLEKRIYHESLWISALSEQIKVYIEYNLENPPKILVLPNVADCDFYAPNFEHPDSFNEQNPFVIGYTGAFGYANDLDKMIKCATECQENQLPIKFELMGDGADKEVLIRNSTKLKNVRIHDHSDREGVKSLLNKCHAVYISFRDELVLGTGSPNKLMDGLATGKLIIVNFEGWVRQLVEGHECGFFYESSEDETFTRMINPFLSSTALLEQYQKNARVLAENEFELNSVMRKLVRQLEDHRLSITNAPQ